MRFPWQELTLLCLLTATVATPSTAQSAFPGLKLRPGTEVRVNDATGGSFRGTFLRIDRGTLEISTIEGTTYINREAIDSLWGFETSTVRGVIIGGAAGLAVGTIGGLLVNALLCNNTACLQAIPVLAVAGGAAGAYVGGQKGSTVFRWRLRIPW